MKLLSAPGNGAYTHITHCIGNRIEFRMNLFRLVDRMATPYYWTIDPWRTHIGIQQTRTHTRWERETDLITISIRESEILNHWIFEHSALFSVYLFFFFMYNIYCYFCVCARVRYARLNFNFIIYNPKFSEWNDDTRHRNQTNKWATTKPTTYQ